MPCVGKYCAKYTERCPKCKRETWFVRHAYIGPRIYGVYRCDHHKPKYSFRVRLYSPPEKKKLTKQGVYPFNK